MMMVALLKSSDNEIYADLKTKHPISVRIWNGYPKTLNGAYNFLETHSTSRNLYPRKQKNTRETDDRENHTPGTTEEGDDMQFMQVSQTNESISQLYGGTINKITCHTYNKRGHYLYQCPNKEGL